MTAPTGTCPKCRGTGRVPATGDFKQIIAGYDPSTDTFSCNNCGGQTMEGRATGVTPLRPDGTPCLHEWAEQTIGPCLYEYYCLHCPARFIIDSGD